MEEDFFDCLETQLDCDLVAKSGDGSTGNDIAQGTDCDTDLSEWIDWKASDDVKGGDLPAHLVYAARLKELAYLKNRCVYEYASTDNATAAMGRRPLGLKWIDTNKGDTTNYDIRSRLVC